MIYAIAALWPIVIAVLALAIGKAITAADRREGTDYDR